MDFAKNLRKLASSANAHHDASLLLLRTGISAVLLYFGVTGLIDPQSTLGWIAPQIKTFIGPIVSLELFAYGLAATQTMVALLILSGTLTRILGLAGFFMMLSIVTNLFIAGGTLDDLIMRDIAIGTADLVLFFFGPGKYSMDRKFGLE